MNQDVINSDSLFVLIEGCRIPAFKIKYTSAKSQPGRLDIAIPYHPTLWPPVFEITKRPDEADEIFDPHGLKIINDVKISGMQPHTRVQAFITDEHSGKTVLIQEGKLMGGVTMVSTPDQSMLNFSALCSGVFPQEIQMYMTDKSRSLGISSGSDWDGELGASSPSDVASRIISAGMSQGIIAELKNAGLNSNYFLHILWRMMRYDKRFIVVDNPKALGFFNGSRLQTLFSETISKMDNKSSIGEVILYILNLLRYNSYNTAFPSFVDKTQELPPIEDSTNDPAIDAGVRDVASEVLGIDLPDESPYPLEEDEETRELMINDYVCSPGLLLSPPPRCNVVLPNQYGQLQQAFVFNGRPTRMIVRATGQGKLSVGDDDAVVMPEDMKQALLDDKNYSSPEETYRGIIFSSGALSAPKFMSEMGSDYVKGFYRKAYDESKQGIKITIGGGTFNPRAMAGLPIAVFQKDGNHVVGNLDALAHTFSAGHPPTTEYNITGGRPYDTPITEHGGDFWYESNIFAPEHIGIYLYPKLIGAYAEERFDVPWHKDDMSILALLYKDEMTDEEVVEAKSDPLAIKTAMDLLFAEYNATENKQEYSRRIGRRSQITFDEFIKGFYGCAVSADGNMATGGYSIATNSISTFSDTISQEAQDDIEDSSGVPADLGTEPEEFPTTLVLGNKVPDDAKIRGCYTKERQAVYVQAMQFFIKTKNIPQDPTFMADGFSYLLNADIAEQMQSITEGFEPPSIEVNYVGVPNSYPLP